MAWVARVGLAGRDQGVSTECWSWLSTEVDATPSSTRNPHPPEGLQAAWGDLRCSRLARGEPAPACVALPSSSPHGASNATHAI